MKILVTVGTTEFDWLIRSMDMLARAHPSWDVLSQVGPGSYEPRYHPHVIFEEDLFRRHKDRLVVTHCGAGTVYSLLEEGRQFVAVPNLERSDKHQTELAEYLAEQTLALVAQSTDELETHIKAINDQSFKPHPYVKDPFFRGGEIRRIIDTAARGRNTADGGESPLPK